MRPKITTPCAVEDCERTGRIIKGWCFFHYQRWARNGDPLISRRVTHGLSYSSTYSSWDAMRYRCSSSKHKAYKNYGGRGISVCERWQSFANFLADMGERPEGTTLDRIDNNGNYEPGNCRWATWDVQAKNRRPQRRIS